MICIICGKEIIGPYIAKNNKKYLCRHIQCGTKVVYAKSEVLVSPKDVVKYADGIVDDCKQEDVLKENTIGETNV